ncbi:MAG: phosphomannomutase/phosphoglucomutase [Actinomycetia bacterium]|nr:phosphomannomutase/phosphoglucomutase [Actinomycetes bacterium]
MSGFDAIFKAYDIRGVYPDQIDADRCRAIGAAFAHFVRGDDPEVTRAVIAHDMRPSGPELVEAFTAGVVGQGLDVVELGLASTDMMYFASGHLDAPGAVFTASHNPAQYNGIKLCRRAAAPIGEESGLAQIQGWALSGLDPVETTGAVSSADLLGSFAAHVLSFVDRSAMRPLKVVADTANGMGGLVVPAVFDHLPFELEILFPELDGTFPNHPADPLNPDNLADLQKRVLEVGADIGLAFDGDADRVFLVDEQARPVSGSLTTALLARALLEQEPGGQVIHNLICSKTVPEVVSEAGGTPIRSRVGHSFIKQVMADTGAIFGGEHSAHYYFRDNWRADSGLIAAVKVLEQLCLSGGSLSTLLEPLDRYAASGEINTKVADPAKVIDHVASHYADATSDRLDGLTVDEGDWWFNLRPSNTEPLLRLNLEAPTEEECAQRVSEVQAVMASA